MPKGRRSTLPERELYQARDLRFAASNAALLAVQREGFGKAVTQVEGIILSADDGQLVPELARWIRYAYESLEMA